MELQSEEEETVEFVGRLAGNGEVICCTSPCELQDYNMFAVTRHSATYHHRLYHKLCKYSARDFAEALTRWLEPRLPLSEGVAPSLEPQEPMQCVPVLHAFKCMIHESSQYAHVHCPFVSSTVRGLRHHLSREHNYPTTEKLLCKSVSAQYTRNGCGPRRALAWVHSYGHMPPEQEPEGRTLAKTLAGVAEFTMATRGVVAAATAQPVSGRAFSVEEAKAEPEPVVPEPTVDFSGIITGNGEVICTTDPCTESDRRGFVDSCDSARTHYRRFHRESGFRGRAFISAFQEWVEPKRPLPVGLSKCEWPQPPMDNVPIVEGYRCRVSTVSGFFHVNCNFISSSIAGLRSHAEKQHHFYHNVGDACQRVAAQYSRCPDFGVRTLVWVEGEPSAIAAVDPKFRFSGLVAGNGDVLCTTFPCTKEKTRMFSDSRASLSKHYKEFHARTDVSSRKFKESYETWAHTVRPLPLGLAPRCQPQPPMEDVPIEIGFKCFVGEGGAGDEAKCSFVSSSIPGLRSHAEKHHNYYSDVEAIAKQVQAQRTRNCRGTRQSLVWVSAEASPLSEEESSDPEKDSCPFPSPELPNSYPMPITAVPVTRYGVLCTTPPCRAEDGRVVLDSFPSAEAHQQEHHLDSGRNATEFYRAFRDVVAPHQQYRSLAPPKQKRCRISFAGDRYHGGRETDYQTDNEDHLMLRWPEHVGTKTVKPSFVPDFDTEIVRKYLNIATSSVRGCPLTVLWQVQELLELDEEPSPKFFLSEDESCFFEEIDTGGGVSLAAFGQAFVTFAYHRLLRTVATPADHDLILRLATAETSDATRIEAVHHLLLRTLEPEASGELSPTLPLPANPSLLEFVVSQANPSLSEDTLQCLQLLLKFCALVFVFSASVSPIPVMELRWHDRALLCEMARVCQL